MMMMMMIMMMMMMMMMMMLIIIFIIIIIIIISCLRGEPKSQKMGAGEGGTWPLRGMGSLCYIIVVFLFVCFFTRATPLSGVYCKMNYVTSFRISGKTKTHNFTIYTFTCAIQGLEQQSSSVYQNIEVW